MVKMMKIIPRFRLHLPLLVIATLFTTACTIDRLNDDSVPADENEFRLAGQIIGESVSESDNGILSSFPEAFAVPNQAGLIQGETFFSLRPFGNLQNYSYQFNASTGIHSVEFSRAEAINNQVLNSDVSLTYHFRDADGNSIANPSQNMQAIESVEFSSTRSGSIETANKSSFFTRTDRFFIDGLSSNSPKLLIDGLHSGEGLFIQIQTDGSTTEREYILDMNFLNVSINKEIVESNRNFRSGVNGALSYESTIRENTPVDNGTKIVNGTLEFTGDGTALLKFRDFFDVFRVRLDSGTVFDDDEFEGRVISVELSSGIITLVNGQRIQITSQTAIDDDGDYFTLQEVSGALENNERIKAEGDYFRNDETSNLWTATEVEFEVESNEFDEPVIAIDPDNGTFTVVSGDLFYLNDTSEIDDDGDFLTLTEVQNALSNGEPVSANGKFNVEQSTGRLIVKEVGFELELNQIEELVTSVNPDEQFFTVESGKQIRITESTIIDDEGYLSLEEVSNALDQGKSVKAEADIFFNSSTGFWIAVEVEFEDAEDEED